MRKRLELPEETTQAYKKEELPRRGALHVYHALTHPRPYKLLPGMPVEGACARRFDISRAAAEHSDHL